MHDTSARHLALALDLVHALDRCSSCYGHLSTASVSFLLLGRKQAGRVDEDALMVIGIDPVLVGLK